MYKIKEGKVNEQVIFFIHDEKGNQAPMGLAAFHTTLDSAQNALDAFLGGDKSYNAYIKALNW